MSTQAVKMSRTHLTGLALEGRSFSRGERLPPRTSKGLKKDIRKKRVERGQELQAEVCMSFIYSKRQELY